MIKKNFIYKNFLKEKIQIHVIILILFSILANQYIANRGAFPIDSFLIFDAAFNIISGNHPFKDYWLITGPFLDYVQSFFFMIFGVSWKSYVLHASILNMILTVFSYYFFQNIGLKKNLSFLYSLGVAILAYPSIGTPFIDHHSVIFCILAVFSISIGMLSKKKIFWFLIPILLTFSFFSKQIPSPYFVILFIIFTSIYFFLEKKIDRNIIISLLGGILFSLLIILSVFLVNGIPIKNFLIQYIYYPLSLGNERINKLNFDFKNLIDQFKFIYLALLPLIVSTYFLIKNKVRKNNFNKELIVSLIFVFTIIILIYCQLLTKNQILIYFLIPISAAYSHSYVQKYLNKKYLIYFIIGIFIFATAKYHIRFNENRKFIELVDVDLTLSEDITSLDKRLNGLKWITPHYSKRPLEEINLLLEAKNILLSRDEEKIIITDYQFFNSLINNSFASPNKWYDDLSIPNKQNIYYNTYKSFFFTQIKKNKIKSIFFIGKSKSEMYFFQEFIKENDCVISNEINQFLLEYNIKDCKF